MFFCLDMQAYSKAWTKEKQFDLILANDYITTY